MGASFPGGAAAAWLAASLQASTASGMVLASDPRFGGRLPPTPGPAMSAVVIELDEIPDVPMWRLALARKPGLRPEQSFGPLEARVQGITLGDSARYRALCSLPEHGPMPVLWPFLTAAPVQKALLLHPEFPLPAMGIVHVGQTVQTTRAIDADEPLSLRVSAGPWQPARRGVHAELDTRFLDAEGHAVWQGCTTIWSPHGPGHGQPNPERSPPPHTPFDHQSIPVPEWMGRQYGSVAGDRNPIHVHTLLARLFGFRRAIVHGMWTVGRCLAALGDRATEPALSIRAEFLRPVELPSEGSLSLGTLDDGSGSAFVWTHEGRTCLWGTVCPAPQAARSR